MIKKSITVTEKQMRMDEIGYIRAKLIAAEQSEFTDKTPDEIRAEFKERLMCDDKL